MCDETQKLILSELKKITRYYDELRQDPLDEVLQLNPLPKFILLSKKNRHRNALFVTTATSVIADIPGAGIITISLTAGWNQTDFIEGTKIYTPSASNVQVLYRCTNSTLGGNII